MGKSKRNKVVALTKTKKKDKSFKEALIEKIREHVDKYKNVFLFNYTNMRTNPFKDIQQKFGKSKFILGKNKVIQIALGKDKENEYKENIHKISEKIKGDCGLFFTNDSPKEIINFLKEFEELAYAKAGTIANKTIVLEKGSDEFSRFSHSMEPYLRKLELNTSLVNSQVVLNQNYVLAESEKALNPEQCKILKLLEIKLGLFKINPLVHWNKSGAVKEIH